MIGRFLLQNEQIIRRFIMQILHEILSLIYVLAHPLLSSRHMFGNKFFSLKICVHAIVIEKQRNWNRIFLAIFYVVPEIVMNKVECMSKGIFTENKNGKMDDIDREFVTNIKTFLSVL